MLKDRMETHWKTRTSKHEDGSVWFKCRTIDVRTKTDERPEMTDVHLFAKEFYTPANETSHTSIDVHVQDSTVSRDVMVFDLDDGNYSIIVANVSLFLNREQFEALQAAIGGER